jgi:hypothetical protein
MYPISYDASTDKSAHVPGTPKQAMSQSTDRQAARVFGFLANTQLWGKQRMQVDVPV